MPLVVSSQSMRNDNKPNLYHHALGHCEMDFLYSLNNPVSSTISNFTDSGDKGGIGKTYRFTAKSASLRYTYNGTWENNSATVIFFLSHAASVSEVHNVIAQLHFRFTLIISKHVWLAGWSLPQIAPSCLPDLRYLSLKCFFSQTGVLKLCGVNKNVILSHDSV